MCVVVVRSVAKLSRQGQESSKNRKRDNLLSKIYKWKQLTLQ